MDTNNLDLARNFIVKNILSVESTIEEHKYALSQGALPIRDISSELQEQMSVLHSLLSGVDTGALMAVYDDGCIIVAVLLMVAVLLWLYMILMAVLWLYMIRWLYIVAVLLAALMAICDDGCIVNGGCIVLLAVYDEGYIVLLAVLMAVSY